MDISSPRFGSSSSSSNGDQLDRKQSPKKAHDTISLPNNFPPLTYDPSDTDDTCSLTRSRRLKIAAQKKNPKLKHSTSKLHRTQRWRERKCTPPEIDPMKTDNHAHAQNAMPPLNDIRFTEASSSSLSDTDLRSMEKRLNKMAPQERLKHMRRPSTIVPDIRLGARLEAGMTTDKQEAFKRLVLATSFRMQSLDRNGNAQPMPKGQRSFYGLGHYSPRLVPPPTERSICPTRVPKRLLSTYYRGKGLERRFSKNDETPRHPKIKKFRSQCKHCETDNDIEQLVSNPSDYIADFEYWCPTSEFEEAERQRVLRRAKESAEAIEVAKRVAKEAAETQNGPDINTFGESSIRVPIVEEYDPTSGEVSFSKQQFLQHVLNTIETKSDDEANSKSDMDNSDVEIKKEEATELCVPEDETKLCSSAPQVPEVQAYVPAPEHLEKRQRTERIDEEIEEEEGEEEEQSHPLFESLLASVMENPESVLKIPDMRQPEPMTVDSGAIGLGPLREERVSKLPEKKASFPKVEKQENVVMTKYEVEQSLAMSFCERRSAGSQTTGSHVKVHKKEGVISTERKRKRKRDISPTPSGEGCKETESAKEKQRLLPESTGWKIMQRLGFRSRLGLMEDGLEGPLETHAKLRSQRSGVGAKGVTYSKTS